jgi:hypothetical protein
MAIKLRRCSLVNEKSMHRWLGDTLYDLKFLFLSSEVLQRDMLFFAQKRFCSAAPTGAGQIGRWMTSDIAFRLID